MHGGGVVGGVMGGANIALLETFWPIQHIILWKDIPFYLLCKSYKHCYSTAFFKKKTRTILLTIIIMARYNYVGKVPLLSILGVLLCPFKFPSLVTAVGKL